MADQKVTVNIPKFNGATKDFQMWWTRFMSYATVYRFVSCLKDAKENDMPATNADFEAMPVTSSDEIKAQKAADNAVKRNNLAMATFTMAFTTEALMNVVYKAQSDDWPQGLAHLVVKALLDKYRPRDLITRVELRQQMNAISMKKDDDPTTLFEQIAAVENQYTALARQLGSGTKKITLDEEDIMGAIIDKAPKEYQSVLTSTVIDKGSSLKREDLEKAMTGYYRTMARIHGYKTSHPKYRRIWRKHRRRR